MHSKLVLLHIISDSNYGGAGNYVKTLCTELNTKFFDIQIALPINSQLKDHLNSHQLHEMLHIAEKSFDVKGCYALYQLIKKLKPQIVHTHGSLSGRIAAQWAGVPKIIYTKHTLSFTSSKLKLVLKKLMNKALRAEAIAISTAARDNLIEEGFPLKHIHLVYNGIRPNTMEYPLVKHDVIRIVLVGRLEPIKGHEHMLEITQQLVEKSPLPFIVEFVGVGSLENQLKEEVQSKSLPVKFVGFVNNIGEIYKESDIVVNTSNSEALCYVAMEGMTYGKPVIAFDLPGINEVIVNNETGYLIPFKNYDLFTSQLIMLIENATLREQLGKEGSKRIQSHFDVKVMAKHIQNIYLEAL